MLIAHYIGSHRGDTLLTRLGWALVRVVQRGPWRRVTHVEAIHEVHDDGTVTIASSSLREGGVRSKRVKLNPAHWLIVDVPQWDVRSSIEALEYSRGSHYDWRGAAATVLPFRQSTKGYFCTEWVALPFLHASHLFGPAQLAAITMSLGEDITESFFAQRQNRG
jgi:hypothetical protein